MRSIRCLRANHFFQLTALTCASSLLASLFLVALVLNHQQTEVIQIRENLVTKEVKKELIKFPNNSTNTQETNHSGRIKHIQKSEITEDHCVLYDFVKANGSSKKKTYEPISLALHSTINYAYHIVQQATTWSDLISYSIFLYPEHESVLFLLKQIYKCSPEVTKKVSMHLVWKRGFFQTSCDNPGLLRMVQILDQMDINCEDYSLPKLTLDLKNLPIPVASYPINIMRNEARRGATTKLHLVADIETQFSYGFADKIRTLTKALLENKLGKAVLVYRRFEMDADTEFPKTIMELKQLFDQEKLFEFHWFFFKRGHSFPRLPQWLDYAVTHKTVKYEGQTYFRQEWEPQFIMRSDAPYHLEFVPTRFNDHQTLCHQLCRAGYNFLVMSHVFNIHPGIKRYLSPIEGALSKLGKKKSPAFIKKFNAFLDKTYPSTKDNKKCPKMGLRISKNDQ